MSVLASIVTAGCTIILRYELPFEFIPKDPRIYKVEEICDYIDKGYKDIIIINNINYDDDLYLENEKEIRWEFKFLDETKGGMTEEKAKISYEIRSYIQDYLENHPEHFLITENYKITLHFYPYYDSSFKLYNMYGQG